MYFLEGLEDSPFKGQQNKYQVYLAKNFKVLVFKVYEVIVSRSNCEAMLDATKIYFIDF